MDTETVIPPTPVADNTVEHSLMESAVCLLVKRSGISRTRTVTKNILNSNADKTMVHVSKDLFDSFELKYIASLDIKIDELIRQKCLPLPMKQSVYLLPLDLLDEVENALSVHVEKRDKAVDAFCAILPNAISEAKARLGDLFDSSEYPTPDQVKHSFKFTWQYLQFTTSPKLEALSKSLYDREKKKAEDSWVEAKNAIQQALRESMAGLVGHLVDRLSTSTNNEGKQEKKIFRNSMMDKIKNFLNDFDARNLSNDAELKKLVDQAKLLTEGVSPESLRTNEGARASVQAGFEQIKSQLDTMLITAPKRGIRLAD